MPPLAALANGGGGGRGLPPPPPNTLPPHMWCCPTRIGWDPLGDPRWGSLRPLPGQARGGPRGTRVAGRGESAWWQREGP